MDPKAVELQAAVIRVLQDDRLDDRELLKEIEQLAASDPFRFPGFSHLWAPELYRRNRFIFREFILYRSNAFGDHGYYDDRGNLFNPWSATETRKTLEELLDQCGKDNEVRLFRRLYEESIGGSWRGAETWRTDLKNAFLSAADDRQRRVALEKYDLPSAWLDEPTALALYQRSPSLCSAFILAHAPTNLSSLWGKPRGPWHQLRQLATEKGDIDFEQKLFRLQATEQQWAERVRSISPIASPQQRVDSLDRIHPPTTPRNATQVYYELLTTHGSDVLPYVMKHLDLRGHAYWSGNLKGLDKLIQLAWDNGWLALWAGLLRNSDEASYNRAITNLLDDQGSLGEYETKRRLLLLAGLGQEMNHPGFGLALALPLTEKTAMAMYRRFPDLLRTSFRHHCRPDWAHTYESLVRAAIEAPDETLVDWFASRVITMVIHGASHKHAAIVRLLVQHYETLQPQPETLARRCGAVLSAIPAGVIGNYDYLLRNNALAQWMFQQKLVAYLHDPRVVRDFLESPQIHVNQLGFHILSLDDPAVAQLSEHNLDLLCAALLRKLHRRTRLLAIDALLQAVRTERAARVVLPKARAALRLPDKRYPKENLIALIATILHRHPSLRSEREQPPIFDHRMQP